MSTLPLTTRAELDQVRCEEPCCPEINPGIVLYSTCHPESLAIPIYHEGELRLECGDCGEIYISIPVAG